ncbi:putative enzyme related to lactoylglutathione lyase [Lentzea atacamensis]|uniref:Putative enzyme related to lactoylglutathione lyase n=1 Tax=Lentzea atacamensis TaxID=531938 RepID=A0A316I6K9_9PSEU|nr:VOC family protein [Lentzea atacamensis]PWK89082.1 putative enzyme related to lactoylglutathione lyase [Lentzea atacamensis]
MDINIHATFLPHTDPDASLAFYRDLLGWEVRGDVGKGTMRWITVAPAGSSSSVVLEPPAMAEGLTDTQKTAIAEMIEGGSYGYIQLSTPDLEGVFDKLQAGGGDVVQEPTDQPWGARDCVFRDPAGNNVRIIQV